MLFLLLARRKGFVSPAIIWCASFSAALIAAGIGQFLWDDLELSAAVAFILLMGVIIFVGVSLLIEKACLADSSQKSTKSTTLSHLSAFSGFTIAAICFFAIFTCVVYFRDVQMIVNNLAGKEVDLSATIEMYRNYTIGLMRGTVEEAGKISPLASISFRALEVIGVYVLANFIFLPNELKKKTWKRYSVCIALIAFVLFFPTGSRSPLVHYVIAAFVLIGLYFKIEGKKVTLRMVVQALLVCGIILCAFAVLSIIRGENMRLGILGYLSFFLGSGVASLNHVIDLTMLASLSDPFAAFYEVIGKIGIEISSQDQALWVSFVGYDSNVFTAFANYYAAFGLVGVAFYSILLALLASSVYVAALKVRGVTWVASYAFFGYVLFDAIRSDALSSLIGVPLVEYVFFLITIPVLLAKINEIAIGNSKNKAQYEK